MAAAYPEPSPQPSGNLVAGAALGMMDDKKKRADGEALTAESANDGGPIKDETWSQVDLRKDKTPDADLPSDIKPHES